MEERRYYLAEFIENPEEAVLRASEEDQEDFKGQFGCALFPFEEAAQKFAKQFKAATKPRASDEKDTRLSKAKWNSWKEENIPSTKEVAKAYSEIAVAENPELFQALRDAEAAEKKKGKRIRGSGAARAGWSNDLPERVLDKYSKKQKDDGVKMIQDVAGGTGEKTAGNEEGEVEEEKKQDEEVESEKESYSREKIGAAPAKPRGKSKRQGKIFKKRKGRRGTRSIKLRKKEEAGSQK